MPKVPFWVFILIAIVYFTAIRVDTMDIDASQYAEISREMMKSGDYLHIFDRGMEYLDKPPFLFWVSATSMKVFGVNNFGYKLPSLLFALLAIYATYRLAKLLYGEVTGRMAALVLATCQGMFLMTNDVRCDTILMSCVVTAIWLIREWVVARKPVYFFAGCVAIGLGMMTKGPIALMVPVFCFMSDWILKRQWRNIFQPIYLLGIVVIAILLVPMSIGLYQQFDLHPEKVIDGRHGVSGLRFFYWSQSFGRITGESPWKNDVDITFLLLNMLWSFLPWIFLFVVAIIMNTVNLVRQKFRLQPHQEWIATGGFLLTYAALGSSAYQLPHYIFVAYPLAAIVTARFLFELIEEKKYRGFYLFAGPFQAIIISLVFFVALVLLVYVFPAHPLVIAAMAASIACWLYIAFHKHLQGKLLWLSACGFIIVNIFLTNCMYYPLLQYQAGSMTGRYIHSHSIAPADVASYNIDDPLTSIHFYAGGLVSRIDNLKDIQARKYLLTADAGLAELKQSGRGFEIAIQGQLYKVSELTPEFLNPKTRNKEVKNYYLVHLK
jgi:4-amino-4-deoxy-L-arabinose transferase-like glycosyltransferase